MSLLGHRFSPWLLASLTTCFVACSGPEESTTPAPSAAQPSQAAAQPSQAAAQPSQAKTVPIPASITDAASLRSTVRRLAGLEVGLGEPWDQHAEELGQIWQAIEERHLHPMAAWAGQELASLTPADTTLFYPFGGPDLSSAHRFFPGAANYILIGLEPPGTLPQLEGFEPQMLSAELERLRGGFDSMVEAGYFVAKHMEQEFVDAHRLDGMLPVIYIELAREGFVPLSVRYFTLSSAGGVVYPETVTTETARAVEIEFVADGESEATPRRLYYISQDLSNDGFEQTPGFERFLAAQAPLNVYMKSAMYLPHRAEFSYFDGLVSTHARNLLQDDSGIPLSALEPSKWDLRLFGVYTATLANYQEWFQPGLRDAYAAQAEARPVDFSIGYNSRISGSCLIWAQRSED